MVLIRQKLDSNTAPYQKASATLLSMQPSYPEGENLPSQKKVEEWQHLVSHLEERLQSLYNWRESWWVQLWSNVAQFLLPRRSIWLTQSTGGTPTPNSMFRGQPLNTYIKDPTATFALRVCSAGMMSALASESKEWFKMLPIMRNLKIDSAGRQWLDDTENRMYTVLSGSNFYNSFAQECEDLTAFGTAPSIIYEDEKDIIRLYNPAVGEYYLSSSASLRVDGLYRKFVMTVSQIVEFFTLDNCTPDIQALWAQKGTGLDTELIIAHSIEPNFEVRGCPKLPGNFAWREVYWVWGSASKRPLSVKGFVEQPFTAARWSTQSNDAYGRSPGMDVLPDVMQLQVMTLRLSEAIEKQVRPPMAANTSLKNQPSSILPGAVTFVDNLDNGMRPIYQVNPDIKGLAALIAQIQERTKVGLFNDLWLMLEQAPDQKMTAYEVAQKIQEKLQVLGPVIENIITESLKPKLKRIFGIMQRKGLIAPPPPSMKGVALDVEFISMLSLAQKASVTSGIERILALVGNLAAVYPEAKFLVDIDATVREMNTLLANPEKILNGPEKVQQLMQQATAQAAQQAKEVSDANQAKTASTGADAAQTLAQTQIGGGQTALAALMGQSGGH